MIATINFSTRRRRQKGGAVIEMALLGPILILLTAGAIDIARVMYTGMEAATAARAGVQYGAQSTETSTDYAGMQTTAINAAPNVSGLTATASKICTCSTIGAGTVACNAACGSGSLKAYVTVTSRIAFRTVLPYPGVPSSIPVKQTVWMRVQ
ncbi:MAG: pilus assembly protein [Candidatus Solibacter usitatus]|nr:pilus assembly protein [Candidatus Solibacter usitatus]